VCVVDLYGIGDCEQTPNTKKDDNTDSITCSAYDMSPYDHTTIQNVFSSSKAVTSVVLAMLVDRKLIAYDTKVSEVWPEFAANGKQDITLEDVLKHEAGLQKLREVFTLEQLQRSEIKRTLAPTDSNSGPQNKYVSFVSKSIANALPKWFKTRPTKVTTQNHLPPHLRKESNEKAVATTPDAEKEDDLSKGRSRAYHAITRGWILNEIVMRVDPQHRTIGEFIRDEIAKPLNLGTSLTMGPESGLFGSRWLDSFGMFTLIMPRSGKQESCLSS
jgi:CubicO group peptidase (beta-lactamase class C family)